MTKIIGGVFGLDLATLDPTVPPFLDFPSVFLVNARSGIRLVVSALNPPRVWLPSYLCPAIVDSVRDFKHRVRFFPVNRDLEVGRQDWIDEVQVGDFVLLIDYFGFPADRDVARKVRGQGAWLMLDACQAMFAKTDPECADFALYSPRKFLGVPDGGVLSILSSASPAPSLLATRLAQSPSDWWLDAFRSVLLRREFDLNGSNRLWFELFQRAEDRAPIGNYAMSPFAKILLEQCFNYDTLAIVRRANFECLSRNLRNIALYAELPPDVVPLGFPVRLSRRDALRERLFEQEIYPPVHWHLGDAVPAHFADSHRLETEIMTIPCDQRYGEDDMERLIDVIGSVNGT